jgi:hypothetical protein
MRKKIRNTLSYFVLFLLISQKTWSQSAQGGIDLRYKIGFLSIHHASMAHLPKQLAQAIEITYFQHSKGKRAYQRYYNFPTFGGTLFHGSVGNDALMGRYTGIYGFSELPVLKIRSFETNVKLATGVAITDKCFQNAPQNIAIGSYVNAIICVGAKALWRGKNQHASIGIDMTHFSNGAAKLPNYGINMPYLSLGYGRNLPDRIKGGLDTSSLAIEQTLPKNKWLLSVLGIYGNKEVNDIGGPKYNVFGLNLSAKRFFNFKAGWEMSVDLISKQAIHAYLPEMEKTQVDILQLGLYSAYLVPFDRFHFVFGMGVYLRDKYKPEDPVYHRIGCRYQFPNGIIGNFTLKTHFGRADYLEWGIGYTFKYN